MAGLKVNNMGRKQVAAGVRAIPAEKDFVWDGKDEDDRPLNTVEMLAGMAAAKKRGRPAGSGSKEQVSVRFDQEVLAAFRAEGSDGLRALCSSTTMAHAAR